MSFDYRTADRESHTHAAGFSGEEGVEQPIRVSGGDSDTAVLQPAKYHFQLATRRLLGEGRLGDTAWGYLSRLPAWEGVCSEIDRSQSGIPMSSIGPMRLVHFGKMALAMISICMCRD
jgi:hypothetical protein